MKTRSLSFPVSPTVGAVSAECIEPENSICIMTLAHGAGAGMNHSFMVSLANELAISGIATLRFNFPFTENKKGRPDFPAVAHKAIEAAINKAHKLYPSLPLFASGKSFGGRMTSQYMAGEHNEFVKGIIFYGFPLHAIGKPSIERADHLKDITVPLLFFQGTKDEMAKLDLIEEVCSTLPGATLQKIEGANHAFKAGRQNIIEVLGRETHAWIKEILH